MDVARTKVPNGPVAGDPSAFVSRNRNTGNDGPMLLGPKLPVNELLA